MNEVLRKLQLTELEMLELVDKICGEYKLSYSLYGGTLLGAIRHKGFIPWDDDLDICMKRDDYNEFIHVWNELKPEGYVIQNKENTPRFTQSFTKIRKCNTTFLQQSEISENFCTGIFIDIFPMDKIPNGLFSKMFFTWRCLKYQLFTREFVPSKGNIFEKFFSKIMLFFVPSKKRMINRTRLLKKITKFNHDSLKTVDISTKRTILNPYSPTLMEEFIEVDFEGEKFMCMKEWENYLRIEYGDYMKLPPESERVWKHEPVKVSFSDNLIK